MYDLFPTKAYGLQGWDYLFALGWLDFMVIILFRFALIFSRFAEALSKKLLILKGFILLWLFGNFNRFHW